MNRRKGATAGRPVEELMTVSEVIEVLGVSPRTFYRWREVGKAPPALVLPNKELRIWRAGLRDWLDSLGEGTAA
ncbi:MAG: helix-turn-helix transcriptional regulator [Nocardioidaceae bacterium]